MASRHHVGKLRGKRLFRITANKTNVKNLTSRRQMMRGGFHN